MYCFFSIRHFSELLSTPEIQAKIRVVVAITTLLLGPLDVGSSIVAREGILEMILVMANSGDFLQQVKFRPTVPHKYIK